MVAQGINEQNWGVARLVGTNKLIFPPSYAAEAVIGHAGRRELRSILEECLDAYANNPGFGSSYPTLQRWINKEGEITLDSLEERVRTHHEGMAHIINATPIKEHSRSSANVDYATVKRRGDGRKGNERNRKGVIVLGAEGRVVDYTCSCPQFEKEFVRGSFGNSEFAARVACYHISAQLEESGLLPYSFTDKVAVLESFAMKVFRKTARKGFERDKYLLRQDVFSDETRKGIADGKLTVEVIWDEKNISGRAWSIINGVRSYFEQDRYGYGFAGFALDFPETQYEATSAVLVKGDGSGRSIHLLYDKNFGVGELPFVMLTIPRTMWIEQGFQGSVEQLSGRNPVLFSAGKGANEGYFEYFDSRSQSEVIAKVLQPVSVLLNYGQREEYRSVLESSVTEV